MAPVRKVAAILNADVVGYSRLMARDELATMEDMVVTRGLMAASVAAHEGRVVDSVGDEMLADFQSASQALHCAVDIQGRLRERNADRPAERRMQLRIGLNLGDILEQDSDVYGDAVNVAARLQALAEPGGICLSSAMHDLVDGRVPMAFRYAGEQPVKNIPRPVRVYHVESGLPPANDAVARPAPRDPAAARLPTPLSSFVGRTQEIASLSALLGTHRLVTLVGPGGVGKTRLSIEVAAKRAAQEPLRLGFVELAPVTDARLVPQAIADALEVKEDPQRAWVDVLLEAIAHQPTLLVLDNCEHLLHACGDVVARLLAGAPRLRVLATSREPLHITGEIAFPVPPLAVPGAQPLPPADLSRFDAVRLFVERARDRQPAFELDAASGAHVARICRRLDGIALAIELAAARVHTLSLPNIAARLDDRFRLLVSPGRDALPRQQTLRALIDWSHDLLAEPERTALRRLAVFAGSCTLEGAEHVLADAVLPRENVMDVLGRLVDKSLLQMDAGSGRYRLLESVRDYAWEHLERAGESASARRRHLEHYLALAEEARPHLLGAQQKTWLERLDADADNLQAAHAASLELPGAARLGLPLLVALKMYYFNRARLSSLFDGIQASLAKTGTADDPPVACRALHTAGQLASRMGRPELAVPHLEDALRIAREIADVGRESAILQELGTALVGLGQLDAARQRLDEALQLARAQPDPRHLGAALNELAQLHRIRGELDAAEPLYEQALQIMTQLEDPMNSAVMLLNLAMVSIGRDQPARARELLVQAHGVATSLSSRPIGQCTLAVASGLAVRVGDWAAVPRLAGASQGQAAQSSFQLEPADRAFLEPLWERARAALGPAAWAQAHAAGEHEGYAEAMRHAIEWLASVPVSR